MGVTASTGGLRTVAFGSISGTYAAIGTSLTHAASIWLVQNLTDVNVYISWDGVVDDFEIPAYSGMVLDITGNQANNDAGLFIPRHTTFYVRQVSGAPTVGSVNIATVFDSSN